MQKKSTYVNSRTSHLLKLSFKKWMELFQKIPRGSDTSLIHGRSIWRKHLLIFHKIYENKNTKTITIETIPSFHPLQWLTIQCWLQKHSASTVISLKAKGPFDAWRNGEMSKETGTWTHVNLISNPSSSYLSRKLCDLEQISYFIILSFDFHICRVEILKSLGC